jgi:hypothetical protein
MHYIRSGRKTVQGRTPFNKEDYDVAELWLVHAAQRQMFGKTKAQIKKSGSVASKNPLASVAPIITPYEDEIPSLLRASGRVTAAKHLSDDAKYPMLLHVSHPYTRAYIHYIHAIVLQHVGGANTLSSHVNKKYWIPQGMAALKRDVKACVVCRRRDKKSTDQLMAPMPDFRIPGNLRVSPFTTTAIDMAGPFLTKNAGRGGGSRNKRWLLICRCTLTQAIHCEMLYYSATESFLLALERFMATRPKPTTFVCDNGKNFRRGARELVGIDIINIDAAQKTLGINFIFSPSNSPHWNGVVERFVQAAKKALATVLTPKEDAPTDEELNTAFLKVAGYLNNMPISYTKHATDPRDIQPLTPAHFLMGQPYAELAPLTEEVATKYTLRFDFITALLDQFWARLVLELTTHLRTYTKWPTTKREVQVGDIAVLLAATKRNSFPLVRVTQVDPGRDGIGRRIVVFNGKKYSRRSITNISIILQQDNPEGVELSEADKAGNSGARDVDAHED